MHGRSMLIAGPREPSVSLQGQFDRLMWPEPVIATSNQHWARARSVAGLVGRIDQQCQKLRRASVSRVATHGCAGIFGRRIEAQAASVGVIAWFVAWFAAILRTSEDAAICFS
jgi:hypothetical protein